VDEITANDTSFGCAHWPRSGLENAVFETCWHITHDLREQFPLGEDVKVMGARFAGEIVLTCAIPFMALQINDADEYVEAKGAVHNAVETYARKLDSRIARVDVNTADNVEAGAVYLTLTGTSAEMGDDGSVGRGNRVTGIIAPFRAASLEAAAGKNPISHVGKLYNVLSFLSAKDIVAEVDEVRDVQVYILSQIGKPLDQPLIATAVVTPKNGSHLSDAARIKIEAVVSRHLEDMQGLRDKLARQDVMMY
jgi:S-adenosylmethionine synthetase